MTTLAFRRLALSACLAVAAAITAAAAQQMISYRYDGVYVGASVATAFSEAACGGLTLNRIEIKNGILRAWDGDRQTVKGFITHDGFFNADYYFPGQQGLVFEGMVDARGRLTGGVFRGECAWLVDLTKTR